jgi:hypothetical protein
MATLSQSVLIRATAKPCDFSTSELQDMLAKAVQAELTPVPNGDAYAQGEGMSVPLEIKPYVYVNEMYPSTQKFVYRLQGRSFIRSYTIKDSKIALKNDAKPARQQWLAASSGTTSWNVAMGGETKRPPRTKL